MSNGVWILVYAESSVCAWDGLVGVSVFRRVSVELFWGSTFKGSEALLLQNCLLKNLN